MPYVVIVKKVSLGGATKAKMRSYARRLSTQFDSDVFCHKRIVVLLSIDDAYMYIDRDLKVGIFRVTLDDVRNAL